MLAVVRPFSRRPQTLTISFEDFLSSGVMRRQALVEMCRPEDLVLEHLRDFDAGDPDEIRQAFGEACEQALGNRLSVIRLDDHDLRFVRRRFLNNRSLGFVSTEPLPAA